MSVFPSRNDQVTSAGAKTTTDPFDWHPLQRADLMSLQVLNSNQDAVQSRTKNFRNRTRKSSVNMQTQDIEGAQPKKFIKETVNRPYNTNNCDDILGAKPRLLHFALDKPHYNMKCDDIEGTRPNINKFKSTREPSNPLNPVYKLQKVDYVAPEPPKFIRDQQHIDDIEGVRTVPQPGPTGRDPLATKDIKGAQKKEPYYRNQEYDTMNYTDVYAKTWQSKRSTNPLDPVYTFCDSLEEPEHQTQVNKTIVNQNYGAIKTSKPSCLPPTREGTRNLTTLDIADAQANTKNMGPFGKFYQRRLEQARNLTSNEDILGSQTGTFKKGIDSKRVSCPMNPNYQVPGASENPTFSLNDPYGNQGCSVGQKTRPSTAVPINKPPRSQVSQMSENKQMNGGISATALKPPLSVHSGMKISGAQSEAGSRRNSINQNVNVRSAAAMSQSQKSQGAVSGSGRPASTNGSVSKMMSSAQKLDKYISK